MPTREQQKAFFARLKQNGFTIKTEPFSEQEKREAKEDGVTENLVHHSVEIKPEQTLQEIKKAKAISAEDIVDNITKTNTDERLRFDVDANPQLAKLQKMGKIKFINGKWELA